MNKQQKVRVTAVSYLNTKPFIYGIFRSELSELIDLSLDIPSVCAQKLASGAADLSLAPVAVIPDIPETYLVSDFCIGATGPVKTVCIFSEKPISQIKKLYLDFHSKTSATLVPLLCRDYWNIHPEFLPAAEGFERRIAGDTAALIIGDRAIGRERDFPYVYDIGEAWINWTGLPFVFAAWVSARPLDPEFIRRFNAALQFGISKIPELTKIIPAIPGFDMEAYFRKNISYDLDSAKLNGMQRFLNMVNGSGNWVLHRNFAGSLIQQ
ncbi:MAG: menaquinone biosynthesis protein [Thermoanaerobaculia bacterium]|nr:menaquinone biosynthesis protein [Thermoanaerobaculia bacterium]